MACAWLVATLGDEPPLPRTLEGDVDEGSWQRVSELARTGLASPLTTSVGRLFDAVAALSGIRARVNYEGQAAAELEDACDPAPPGGAYPLPLVDEGVLMLDARETVRAVLADVDAGAGPAAISARFHAAVAGATASACALLAERASLDAVALSGGVFQNRTLLDRTRSLLGARGLRVLVPELLPPNDGGISYGQAAVAAAQQFEKRQQ
jgi:hydrogenase maturation protein HypF